MLGQRIGLTERQKKALGLVAEASSNAGEFLGILIEKAKNFSFSELDIQSMLDMLSGDMRGAGASVLESIKESLDKAAQGLHQRFDEMGDDLYNKLDPYIRFPSERQR